MNRESVPHHSPSGTSGLLERALHRRSTGDRAGAVRAAEIARRRLTGLQDGTVARANTALVLGLLAQDDGDYARAAELFTSVASIRGDGGAAEQLREYGRTMIGALHRKRGDYRTAERQLREAARSAHDPAVAAAAHNELGMTQRFAGRFEEAHDSYLTARAELERAHGPHHPELATIHHNLSGLAHARGDLAEAEVAARTAVRIRTAALGPDHPATLADQSALAAVLVSLGRLDEALALLSALLPAVERIHGPHHHEVSVILHNLGSAEHAAGRPAHAIELLTRALLIKEQVLGAEHPELAVTRCSLGLAERALGDATAS